MSYNHGVRPSKNPFHYAFTLTFFGSLLMVLALMGCRLRKSNWTFVGCTWSESVWWSDFGAGLLFLLIAAFFWKRALQTVR